MQFKLVTVAFFASQAIAAIKPADLTNAVDKIIDGSQTARSHLENISPEFKTSDISNAFNGTTIDINNLTNIVIEFGTTLEKNAKPFSPPDQILGCLDFYRFYNEEESLNNVLGTLAQLPVDKIEQQKAFAKSVKNLAEALVKRFFKPLALVLPACSLEIPQTPDQDLVGINSKIFDAFLGNLD